MKRKVALVALGCPKNDVDSEIMMGLLQDRGYEAVPNTALADVVIVNTCAFIKGAQEEAVKAILEAAGVKAGSSGKRLVVTGCMAERYKAEILERMPEVDAVIGTGSIGDTADIVDGIMEGSEKRQLFCSLPDNTDYLDKRRALSETRPFQYLKIAEGCDNKCTYCVIPSLRGPYRSRTIDKLAAEAKRLTDAGAVEIILIAQDVTRYGMDFDGKSHLVRLVQAISALSEVKRIRLLYCYPELVDDALILEMKSNAKLIHYLDLPIQHVADAVLKRMNRRDDSTSIRGLLLHLRKTIPDIVLRTSLITGFPGETEEDFEELRSFVAEAQFEHVGVFDYSREIGTPAARMKAQVPTKTRRKRRDILLALQKENVEKWNDSRVGNTYDTIIEGVSDDGLFYLGRTYAEAPDIDALIYVTSEQPLQSGAILPVRILCVEGYDLIGQAVLENL